MGVVGREGRGQLRSRAGGSGGFVEGRGWWSWAGGIGGIREGVTEDLSK